MRYVILAIFVLLASPAMSANAPPPSPTPTIKVEGVFTGRARWINGEIYEEVVLKDGTIIWVIAKEGH